MGIDKKAVNVKKIDGLSADIQKEKIEALKKLVPEVFSDGKIDVEKLNQVIGKSNVAKDERYRLEWDGKSEVFDEIAKRSACTLTLDEKRSSKDWKESNNIFIEGENLEVLRMLQKAYHEKVKMVYIDPPYNTGKDFVYNDNFRQTEEEYCEDECNIDENGNIKKAYKLNSRDNGRFHSTWLSMIYPRLYLARNLLRRDGILLIYIDDEELAGLTSVCNEIFGEENKIATMVWDKNRKNDARFFSVGHEYLLVYARDKSFLIENDVQLRESKAGIDIAKKLFVDLMEKYDNDLEKVQQAWRKFFRDLPADSPLKKIGRYTKMDKNRGPYRDDGNISWPGGGGPTYDVIHPTTKELCKVPDGSWRYPTSERFWEEVAEGKVVFGPDETTLPRQIRFLFESDGQVISSVNFSYAQTATMELERLIGGKIFENPKNWRDSARLIGYICPGSGIVLDFFAGSGTTAHGVMAQNAEDGMNRQYVCVQIPEETPEGSEARKAGYKKISDIVIDRIKKAAAQVKKDHPEYKGDVGVRVYKETNSHFPQWHARAFETDEDLKTAMIDYNKAPVTGEPRDRATEVLLKLGYPLTTPLEEKKGYFVTSDGVALALDSLLNIESLKKILDESPKTIVVFEKLFKKDEDKINFGLRCKEAGVIFQTV